MRNPWDDFEAHVLSHLTAEDDAAFWKAAIPEIYRDAEYLCRHDRAGRRIVTQLGACSHWLRPHQTRWTADGGFAWPSGYLGREHSSSGLPSHDWSLRLRWSAEEQRWIEGEDSRKRRYLTFRVTLPTRTAQHGQAAVHTIWQPGSPSAPSEELCVFYGFRLVDGEWTLRATSGGTRVRGAFERAADAEHSSPRDHARR